MTHDCLNSQLLAETKTTAKDEINVPSLLKCLRMQNYVVMYSRKNSQIILDWDIIS